MAEAGWYPDPGGAPDRYRYWDGQTWSESTSADPFGAGRSRRSSRPRGETPGRHHPGLWLALGSLAVVLVVVIVLVVRSLGAEPVTVDTDPAPATSTPGADLSTSPASPPAPTPDRCPLGDPLARQGHPEDGRIHGGGLSMPAQPGWTTPGVQTAGFTWGYDVGETDTRVQAQWFSAYAVGALSVVDGFEEPRTATELAMECTVSSSFYSGATDRTDLLSGFTRVGRHPGWTLRSEVRVDSDETTFAGDVVQITVVDLGSSESLAFFWGCAPIGQTPLLERLDRTAAALRAE